jgi:tripartite-type tricarboxylate transporter receptor subunit TctC
MLAPARTPAALIELLHREIVEILSNPETRPAFLAQGAEPAPTTPKEFASFIKTEISKWSKVIAATAVRVD